MSSRYGDDEIGREAERQRREGYRAALAGEDEGLASPKRAEQAEAAAQRRQWFGTSDQRVYIGPDASGTALFRGDTVVWDGRVWRLEDSQLRWVVNGMLTVPLTSVGTMHVVRA